MDGGVPQPSKSNALSTILSTGADVGIGVGAGLGVMVFLVICSIWLDRRQKRMRSRPGWQHRALESEMDGTTHTAWRKPELAANEQPSAGAPPNKYELGSESSRSLDTPTEFESASTTNTANSSRHARQDDHGKEVLQVEKTMSPLPQATQLTPVAQQTDPIICPAQLNVMKAQERELSEAIEADESLRRLKAEHAALQQRIAMAEMQAVEMKRKRAGDAAPGA